MSADSPVAVLFNTLGVELAKSSNTGVPGATNIGTLPAIATAAAPVYIEGNQVALSTDLSGSLRVDVTLIATANVNLAQVVGTATSVNNGVSNAGTQRVTLASDSTGQVTLASGASVIATQSTASNLKAEVVGTKTNNAAVPGATNLGVLGAIANAAAPTWVEANLVGLSVDLAGNLRTSTAIAANSSVNVNQIAGTATSVNNGTSDAGTQRVTIASDSTGMLASVTTVGTVTTVSTVTAVTAITNALPTGANTIGKVDQGTGGASAWKVDGSAVTQPVSGTFFQATQPVSIAATVTVAGAKTNDNAAPGATNIGALTAIANAAAPTWTEANLVGLSVDLAGNLRTSATIAANSSVNVAQIAGTATTVNNGTAGAGTQRVTIASDSTGTTIVTQATASNLNAQVAGDVANASADSGNPVKIGGVGRTTNPTAVTDGQRVNASFDKIGKQLVAMAPRERKPTNTISLTTTTETTLLAAGAAGVFRDLVFLSISNSGNNLNRIDIRDATAGTVRFSIHCDVGATVVVPIPTSWPQTTAANNWTAQLSATPGGGGAPSVRINVMAIEDN